MRAPSTSMNLSSGLLAICSANHFGAGGGEPASAASGPWFSLTVNISGCAPLTGGTGGRSSSSIIAGTLARLGQPFNPGAMRMRVGQHLFLAHAIGIADARDGAFLASEFEREPPYRTAKSRNRQNVLQRLLHRGAELIDGDGVIDARRAVFRDLGERLR